MRPRVIGLLLGALTLGGVIGWIDSRPSWDDTAVTAGVLFITAAAFGAVSPRLAWLSALLLAIWIPLFGIVTAGNFASLLALIVALAGAYVGAGVRAIVARSHAGV